MKDFKLVLCPGACGKRFKIHRSTPSTAAFIYCKKCGAEHANNARAMNSAREFAFKIDDVVVTKRYATWKNGKWEFIKRVEGDEPILTQFKIVSANMIYGGSIYFARSIDNECVQISQGDILLKL